MTAGRSRDPKVFVIVDATLLRMAGLGSLLDSIYTALLNVNPLIVLELSDISRRIDPSVVRPVVLGGEEHNYQLFCNLWQSHLR